MLATAKEAALVAGKMLQENFGKPVEAKFKDPYSLVTEFDLAAENKIKEIIRAKFPDHRFWAEESGQDQVKSEYTWVIDPLDGTTNFVLTVPVFGVSIALLKGGQLELGVVYQPLTKQLFWAQRGQGAWLNDQPLKVDPTTKLAQAELAISRNTVVRAEVEAVGNLFAKISHLARSYRILGSVALNYALVASSKFEVSISKGNKFWDVAAGVVLCQEAGALVTDFQGGQVGVDTKNIIAVSSLEIQEQLLPLLYEY